MSWVLSHPGAMEPDGLRQSNPDRDHVAAWHRRWASRSDHAPRADAGRGAAASNGSPGPVVIAISIAIGACCLLACVANGLSIKYYGQDLNPSSETTQYINDTNRDLIVVRCSLGCREWHAPRRVSPEEWAPDYLSWPEVVLVMETDGQLIGCIEPEPKFGTVIVLSTADDCPPNLPPLPNLDQPGTTVEFN